MSFRTVLTDEQLAYAERRAAELDKQFAGCTINPEVLRRRRYIGECGEIAFVNWLRHWSFDFRRMPVGWAYDFTVGNQRIEVVCSSTWNGNDHHLARQPSTLERNAHEIDLFVGVAMETERTFHVYGCADRRAMLAAPLKQFRADQPAMKAIKIDDVDSTTFLHMILTDIKPRSASM